MNNIPKIETPKKGFSWLKERYALLHGGTRVACMKLDDGWIRTAWNFSFQDVLHAVNEHNRLVSAGIFVKEDVKRQITRIELNGRSLIVKEYRRLHKIMMFSPDAKGWLGSQRLEFSAHCLGWFRKRDASRAWLVFEDAGAGDLFKPEINSEESVQLTQRRFEYTAHLLAAMHEKGIFHADTKPGNFVVDGSEESVTLIDCDDVRIYSTLPRERRMKNLAQFAGCLWNIPDLEIRFKLTRAFFDQYAFAVGWPLEYLYGDGREEWMKFIRKLYPDQVRLMENLK